MKNKTSFVKYIIIGALAGTANGFFGAGGGLFLVPLFIGWAKMDEKKAFATSVAVIFPLCIVSLIVFLRNGQDVFTIGLPFVIGGVCGGLVSGRLFRNISAVWLHRLFGLLLIYGALRTLFWS